MNQCRDIDIASLQTDESLSNLLQRFGGSPMVLIIIATLLSLFRLPTAPPLWWDEGWTLSVARNWVETGHYGRFLDGTPVSPRLAAAPPVVLPMALSFRLFGVGAWQGRLPGVIFTAVTLWFLYRLTAVLTRLVQALFGLAGGAGWFRGAPGAYRIRHERELI